MVRQVDQHHSKAQKHLTCFMQINNNTSEAQQVDGSPVYLKPIPPYPPLKGSKATVAHNLDRFITMTDDDDLGICLSDTEFFAWGGGIEIEPPAQVQSDEDLGPAQQ